MGPDSNRGRRVFTHPDASEKVFAGGDAVHGADLVVTAMAAGRQAARDMLTLFDTKAS